MIRENYGSSSSGDINLNNYVTKSDLNNDVVNIIQNIDYNTYSEASGLKELIQKETVNNFTNVFNNSSFNNMTNLNKWIDYKLTDISSGLFAKEINHKPISNINFTFKVNTQINTTEYYSFNTNNLNFNTIRQATNSEQISVKKGDVIVVFFKKYYDSVPDYIVDSVLLVVVGYNVTDLNKKISGLTSTGNYYYFKANPFTSLYDTIVPSENVNTVDISTNAYSMLTSKYTNTITVNYTSTDINYYYLWSDGVNDFIDFLNTFNLNDADYQKYKTFASSSTVNLNLTGLVDQSFYALTQRNSIQNEVLKMFSDVNILNDLKLVKNLFQSYEVSSIYTSDNDIITPLIPDPTSKGHFTTTDGFALSSRVFVAFFTDKNRNIVAIDLVYNPTNTVIRFPTRNYPQEIDNKSIYVLYNNIFETCNDLVIQLSGCINLNKNLSFIINFMNLRSSESSTHLIIKGAKCGLWKLFNNIPLTPISTVNISDLDFNDLRNYSYVLDLDKLIEEKQGTIMNTPESDNILVEF